MIPHGTQMSGDFVPIAQSPSIINFTTTPTSSPRILQSQMQPLVQQISEAPTQVTTTITLSSSNPKSNSAVANVNISMPDLCQGNQSNMKMFL